MAFRNENVALKTKVEQLQLENERLRRQLSGKPVEPVSASPSEVVAAVAPAAKSLPTSRELAAKIEARAQAVAAAEREASRRAELERAAIAARYAERPRRVRVERTPDRTRIHVAPKLMTDALLEDAGWHFWFLLINPGIFIVMGLTGAFILLAGLGVGTSIALAIPVWVTLLAIGNVIYARASNPAHMLDLHESGQYGLYVGGASEPTLLGTVSELDLDLSEVDCARLGELQISDGRGRIDLDKLSPADVATLAQALGPLAS